MHVLVSYTKKTTMDAARTDVTSPKAGNTFCCSCNWISLAWSCRCSSMQLSKDSQAAAGPGNWQLHLQSTTHSHCYSYAPGPRPHLLPLPLSLHADHANYVAHRRTQARTATATHTHTHTHIHTYMRVHGYAALSPFGRALDWCSETGRQPGQEWAADGQKLVRTECMYGQS